MKKVVQLILIMTVAMACKGKSDPIIPSQTDLQKQGLKGAVVNVKSDSYIALKQADGNYTKVCHVNFTEAISQLWDAEDVIWASVECYNNAGRITSRQILNEIEETFAYQYDQKMQLSIITYSTKDGQWSWQESYFYNVNGQKERCQIVSNSRDKPIAIYYQYDIDGKLIQENYNDERITAFGYDQKGNRISEIEEHKSIGVVIPNRTKYNYTPQGVYTGKEITKIGSELGEHSVIYFDAADRKLREVTDGVTTTYTYNEQGDRIKRESSVSTTTYQYKYDKEGNWIEKIRITCFPNQQTLEPEVVESYMTIREISYKL